MKILAPQFIPFRPNNITPDIPAEIIKLHFYLNSNDIWP